MSIDKNENISPLFAWLGILATFIFALFFILATFIPSSQSALNNNIYGWGWSPLLSKTGSGFGLVSFNDCYCNPDVSYSPESLCHYDTDYVCVSDKDFSPLAMKFGPYGLQVDLQTREITGWIWSQWAGWICFGDSCCNAGNGQNYCDDFNGQEWEPKNVDPDTGNPSISVKYPADQNPAPISGWAKIIGWDSLGDGQMSWVSLRGVTTDDGSEYGLRFSTSTFEISGLGWGGIKDGSFTNNDGVGMPYVGYGWLCINEEYNGRPLPGFDNGLCPRTGVQVAVPYIQTVDGDVYAQTNISPDLNAPSGQFNATYLIMAGGNIQNFSSLEKYSTFSSSSYIMSNFPYNISLPKANTNFFNVLGHLDIPNITKLEENQYGKFEQQSELIISSGLYSKPNHRVIINGDLTLGEDILPSTFTYSLRPENQGWNYVSPVTQEMDGQLIRDVFTNVTGTVYVYNPSPTPATNFEIGKGYIFRNDFPGTEYVIVNGKPIISLNYTLSGGNQYTIGAPFAMDFQGIPCITQVDHYNPNPPPIWFTDWNVAKGEGVWVRTDSTATCRFTKSRTDLSVNFSGGATTFVVNGDLHINRNVIYNENSVTSFKNLPSVAYIVFGDVIIDPEVTEVAGNFIVLGKDATDCPATNCGTIYTGAGFYPLTVNGIMMAKKFVFQRTYASVTKEPAEQVIYDGRLLINTPPGLQDFAKGLPVWSQVAPN